MTKSSPFIIFEEVNLQHHENFTLKSIVFYT